MNTIFKIVLFGLCINFATALMMQLIPSFNELQYNPNLANANDNYNSAQLQGNINPTPDSSNTFFRLIDSLTIGLIQKIISFFDNGMFGLLNFVALIFQIPTGIVYTFKGILTICYTMGVFWLWTGKDVTQ
jgi:hypothetical protein